MFIVKKEGVVLRKTGLNFENSAVLNPACYQEGKKVHMFYRAVRKGNHSTIGYCLLDGPLKVVKRAVKPVFSPLRNFESSNVEDPKIVKIDDTFYLTYTAFDLFNACGALATSKDLKKFRRHGFITPLFTYKQFKDLTSNQNMNPKYFRF